MKATYAYVLMALIFVPLAQTVWPVIWLEPLIGERTDAELPQFSLSGYWTGKFQQGFENWHRGNFGFRSLMIRIRNQFDFTLFGEVHSDAVVVGKRNYLFQHAYLQAWAGTDYLGRERISEMGQQLLEIQDELSRQGKTLVVALAPGKASYFPEYVPEEFSKAGPNNGEAMGDIFREMGINLIDYNRQYQELKGKTEHLLFGKTGIHWSNYGCAISLQEFMDKLEELRDEELPDFVIKSAVDSTNLVDPDDDLAKVMNLLYRIPPDPMALLDVEWQSDDEDHKLRLTAIADSFFQQFVINCHLFPNGFSSIDYYFYNNKVWYSGDSPPTERNFQTPSTEKALESVDNSDVVLIMVTEANFGGLGFGYLDPLYEHLVGKKHTTEATDEP